MVAMSETFSKDTGDTRGPDRKDSADVAVRDEWLRDLRDENPEPARGAGPAFSPANDDDSKFKKSAFQIPRKPSSLFAAANWGVLALSFLLLVGSQLNIFGGKLSALFVPSLVVLFAGILMLVERRQAEHLNRVAQFVNEFGADMNQLGEAAPNKLFDATRALRNELSYMEQAVDNRMRHVLQFSTDVKNIIKNTEDMIDQEKILLADVKTSLDSGRVQLNAALDQVSAVTPQLSAAIKQSLDAGIAQIAAQTPRAVTEIDTAADNMRTKLESALRNAQSAFQTQMDEQTQHLANTVIKLLDGAVADVSRSIAESGDIVKRLSTQEMPKLVGQMASVQEKISGDITGAIPEALSTLSDSVERFQSAMNDRLENHASQLNATIETFSSNFDSDVEQKISVLGDVFDSRNSKLANLFAERAVELQDRLDSLIAQADGALAANGDKLTAEAKKISADMHAASGNVLESMQAAKKDIFEKVDLLERELKTFSTDSEKDFARRADRFLQEINKKLETIEDLFADGSKSITDAMLGHAGQLIKTLRESVGNFDEIFVGQIEKIKSEIGVKEADALSAAEAKVTNAVERLNDYHQSAEKILESRLLLVEFVISEFVKKLENIDATVDQKISSSAKTAVDTIGFHTELVVDNVREEMAKLEQLLGLQNQNLAELPHRLKEIVQLSEAKIFEAESVFATEAARFNEKIDEISRELAESMQSNMGEAEDRTLIKVQELAQSLDKMFERVHTGLDMRAAKFAEVMSRHAVDINRTIVEASTKMEKLRGKTDELR